MKEKVKKLNILIIEDDYDFTRILKEDIIKFMSAYIPRSQFYICNNNYLEKCKQIKCDMAFIDIQLDGKDLGISLAKEILLKNPSVIIVFVTRRDNLMHDTFLVHPFYFIRKSNYKEDFLVFCQLYKAHLKSHNYVTLSYNYYKTRILISKIYYIEVIDHVLHVYTSTGVYKDTRTLKSLLSILKTNSNFVQIHKSYVINLKHVYTYNKGKVILLNKTIINIGRKYIKEFDKKYKEYLLK